MHYPSVSSSSVRSRMRLPRARYLFALLLACAALGGCESFDPELIETIQDAGYEQSNPITGATAGSSGSVAAQPDAGDAGAADAAGMAGRGGDATDECVSDPVLWQLGCPQVCPESCNGVD